MVCALTVVSMMLNPQKLHTGGNAQLQTPPRNASGAARCGPGCRQKTELCCDLEAVLFLECRSPVPLSFVAGISGPRFAPSLVPPSSASRVCRAACSRAGVLGRESWVCSGECGSKSVWGGRDMALDTVQADGRRFEVVVDGFPLFRGAQLAIDTTLVSRLRGDGQPAHPSTRPAT